METKAMRATVISSILASAICVISMLTLVWRASGFVAQTESQLLEMRERVAKVERVSEILVIIQLRLERFDARLEGLDGKLDAMRKSLEEHKAQTLIK